MASSCDCDELCRFCAYVGALRATAEDGPAVTVTMPLDSDNARIALGPDAQQWYDHKGNIMIGPVSERPTGWNEYTGCTHYLMRPVPGQVIQAVSWCGRRMLEVPGHGDVDCPDCLAIDAENAATADGGTAVTVQPDGTVPRLDGDNIVKNWHHKGP